MFRTDLLSIIRSLNTVFTATGIFHTSYVDCLLARSVPSCKKCKYVFKYSVSFLSDFGQSRKMSTKFSWNSKVKLHENPPCVCRAVPWGQTDRRTDMTKVEVFFTIVFRRRIKWRGLVQSFSSNAGPKTWNLSFADNTSTILIGYFRSRSEVH